VLSRFVSSVVPSSVGAASAAVALSTASVFDAEASGGVSSMASIIVIILCFSTQQASLLPRAPFSSVKASSDVAQVDLA
jgi:purine-cytosine permease-like protein